MIDQLNTSQENRVLMIINVTHPKHKTHLTSLGGLFWYYHNITSPKLLSHLCNNWA